MPIDIRQFPCLSDNYGVLIRDAAAGVCASIDAPETDAVKKALADKGWMFGLAIAIAVIANLVFGALIYRFVLLRVRG